MTGLDAFYVLLGMGCFTFLVIAAIHIPTSIKAVERVLTDKRDHSGGPW